MIKKKLNSVLLQHLLELFNIQIHHVYTAESGMCLAPLLTMIKDYQYRGLMLWLFVGPTGVYLLDFFSSGIQFFTVESLSLLYLLFIS